MKAGTALADLLKVDNSTPRLKRQQNRHRISHSYSQDLYPGLRSTSWKMVGQCQCLSLCLPPYLPSSPKLHYSHRSSSVTHVSGGQGECGVYARSKIYEQLKVDQYRASISLCARQTGWVKGTHGKPQAIYFYICFPFKEGRLWRNYVLLLRDFLYDVDIFHGTGHQDPQKEAGIEIYICVCLCWFTLLLLFRSCW